jgi:undecaprenyl diphosphate synthase
MVFQDTLWPDYDRRHLWAAIVEYARRDRRYGGAVPNEPTSDLADDLPEGLPDNLPEDLPDEVNAS